MPAAAVPAAIGLGSSAVGAIGGKGAAKRQEKLAREQMAMMKPLLEQQAAMGKFALEQSKPYIQGAGQGLQDLMTGFYKPLAFGNRSAIDMFLSPERRAINQGYQNVANTAARGPRGSRTSALVRANMQRQGQLSDLVFGARRAGAEGFGQTSQQLGSLGTGLLGAGFGAGQQGLSLLQGQQDRAQRAGEQAGAGIKGLGGALGDFLGGFKIFGGGGYGGGSGSPGGMTGKGK